ncbi:MAG: carbamoyl-phosphate synthase large subunit [Candidatus Tectomicrobia bacterium]|nr:carbamoyl-phosphate synthase large subunit [Candidatus Tectomicrobia bacterium]
MPKRTDLHRILLLGSGPIVIGQACEFDYSGTQACKALREEGYEVVLVNSNPATIMTDPDVAQRTYIEPVTPEIVAEIIAMERPQALLPTMGGQTGLNVSVALAEAGVLDRYGVELIGARLEVIQKAENRQLFKEAMTRIGLDLPPSGTARSYEEALAVIHEIGLPAIIRPSFTLGGTGGNLAYNIEEFEAHCQWGLRSSPIGEVLVERSVAGWKEFELEVMRDFKDNVVIICSIENFDPMGVHTGDSITVAPAQTLTDKEYQMMRDAAIAIMREIGVETGGSNIQFAVNPENGHLVVIEMNPRVSRSSALASKATGFPIAKIAAKLAVGYTLDEIPNDITRLTPSSFEPMIDYCVVKVPRFAFEKFPGADDTLTSQMKSIGEAMAIGRTFKEALQKAIRSLEVDRYGFEPLLTWDAADPASLERARRQVEDGLRRPNWERLWYLAEGLRLGLGIDALYDLTKIDRWFLANIAQIIEVEEKLLRAPADGSAAQAADDPRALRLLKTYGFSDVTISRRLGISEAALRARRKAHGITVTYKTVDTCAAEFVASTPYLYSTYERECEANPTTRRKVVILGGGPNRIGQGIEFDYCCVHAAFALKEEGCEAIMVNCNPETVSTDYDTSDRLYFEPLTAEDVLNIVEREQPWGVIVQFGGQTPLRLARTLEAAGVPIIGTQPESIDRAEDRERFKQLLDDLNLRQPPNGAAKSVQDAERIAAQLGYPVLVRPSYVLGGRAMDIVYDAQGLHRYMREAVKASPEHPVLIDRFLEDAIEIDVDALADGEQVFVAGIMEHIEEAGVHSGDSACSLPPYSLPADIIASIEEQTCLLARELQVVGLINIQFAIKEKMVYILEVNPRASRTVPFVSKATGLPLAKLAAKLMVGRKLADLGVARKVALDHIAVKEAVLPFVKFPGADTILGPEMKSTGEVMGIDRTFGLAFAKAQLAAGVSLPTKGTVFISVRDHDKPAAVPMARQFRKLGFQLLATAGTAQVLTAAGIEVEAVQKVKEGRPHIVDHIKNGRVDLVINTTAGEVSRLDSFSIRRTALERSLPYCTTVPGALAAIQAIQALQEGKLTVRSLQDHLAALG